MYQSKDISEQILTDEQKNVPELAWVDTYSRVLDTKFKIPGTDIRFGADFLLGLIPGVGDVLSLGMSGVLVATMAKNGASPRLAFRMLINVALDAAVGTIPILGNIFDLVYKANYRNAVLMREYYDAGKHTGSVWPVVLMVIAGILLILGLVVWLVVWLVESFFGLF